MAVQLKHDIRGYHAGNISKRYLREAEAADEFELSSNEVIAYATAAPAGARQACRADPHRPYHAQYVILE